MLMKIVRIVSASSLIGLLLLVMSCAFFERPDVPGDFTATYNAEDDYVELHWDHATGVSHYEIYRGDNEDPETFEEIGDNDEAWYDDFNYTYFERFYAIKAENNFGTSDFSEVVEANIPDHDKYEPNNDLTSAALITLTFDEENSQHLSILPAGDIDCIKFSASPTYGYSISIPSSNLSVQNIQMFLYDESGNLVETGIAGDNTASQIFEWQPSQAGNYILKIQSSDASSAGYYTLFIHPWT